MKSRAYPTKMLSPFRYPGGKTWLVPRICQWVHDMEARPVEFVEPFAGGGIVGLNIAFRNLAKHVTLVELDDNVAAVWETILYGDARELANRIRFFDLTVATIDEELARNPTSTAGRAFQTILKNRTNFGGIMTPGAGRLKFGDSGRGILSRWYPETLEKRILQIANMRDRITFVHGDGLAVLEDRAHCANLALFIDPPYTAGGRRPGRRLYVHHDVDHNRLFRVARSLTGDFLMSYADNEEVRALALQHAFSIQRVVMRTNRHINKAELLLSNRPT